VLLFAQIHRDRILINLLIFLNILIPIFGLRKTCREVPFFVPGSPFFRAGKSLLACREVPFVSPVLDTALWNKFVQACREVPLPNFCFEWVTD
jgi:hypothetical protein